MRHQWLRIAHRGASGTAPEHTESAFVRALELGVDMIELDVHLSRDGVLVVIHDYDLQRTAHAAGVVRDQTLAELQALDVGAWYAPEFRGQRLLTLNEVIDIVGTRARLNVEIKAPEDDWGTVAAALVATLRDRGVRETTILSSFAPGALVAVRNRDPGAPLGLLWHQVNWAEAWDWARRLAAVAIHPHWMLVSSEVIDTAHARGLHVITWTVNDVGTMRDLVRRGVDGIISDHPERFPEADG